MSEYPGYNGGRLWDATTGTWAVVSKNSAPFHRIAGAIEHNAEAGFGGAFVVVPPQDGGDPIETLILDTKQDPAQFWSLLQTKAALMIAEIEEKKRIAGTFGRR